MWSPRELHTVTSYNGDIYVVGGFASRLFSRSSNCGAYACGDENAGSYRYYAQDVWRSRAGAQQGELWQSLTLGTINSFPGRGSHQAIILKQPVKNGQVPDESKTRLLVIGGEGGNPATNEVTYFNDIWWTYINNPVEWFKLDTVNNSWPPRAGHTAILEPESAVNNNNKIIYIVGGINHDGILSDVWMWRPDVEGDIWRRDYGPDAIYRSGDAVTGLYEPNSPTIHYITPDSDLSYLVKWWLPQTSMPNIGNPGLRSQPRVLIDEHKLEMLHKVNIFTIRDLAEADKYTILKLRGHDFPGVPDTMDYLDICDIRALAVAAVEKCTINTKRQFYDGEFGMPWNNKAVFGGPPPLRLPADWHNRSFADEQESSDPAVWIDEWDGCKILPLQTKPNVNGLGKVTQVDYIRDPLKEVQELHCKFNPAGRAYHAGLYFEERMYIFGGRTTNLTSRADSWYRDDRMPMAKFKIKPTSNTPDYRFRFWADEPGCVFEYRIWDNYRFKEVRKWTPVLWFTHVDWLDWRMGGPGNGEYVLYVRAIDPAGNRDERFVLGRNMHSWRYISPTPWDIIFGCIAGFIFCAVMAYAEYRRRVKKAAMERYAMKRMRRKFKAMQRDTDGRAVDWRTLYSEHKELKEDDADGKKRAREMKKKREKAKAQREKDKEKRDKEKDKIRKKLKDKEKKKQIENGGGAELPAITAGEKKEQSIKDSESGSLQVGKRDMKGFEGDGNAAALINRSKTNRFKDYEIDDGSKSKKMDKLDTGESPGATLVKGKSSKFKTYEIEDDSKGSSEKPSATLVKGKSTKFKTYEIEGDSKASSDKPGGTIAKEKNNKFKAYEIDDDSKGSSEKPSATLVKGKSTKFKTYEIEGDSKASSDKPGETISKSKSTKFKTYEIDEDSKGSNEKPAGPIAKGKSTKFKSYEIEGNEPKKSV